MNRVLQRCFLGVLFAAASSAGCGSREQALDTTKIDDVLRSAVEQGKVAGVVAMAATPEGVVYEGAFGKRDVSAGVELTPDTIFRFASMTKAITTVAAMQLVEQGAIQLDDPVGKYLDEPAQVEVLDGFDQTGKPRMRPAKTPVTVRHLLTHTSGFGYEFLNSDLNKYSAMGLIPSVFAGGDGFLKAPLVFDPGSRWEYGISTDWLGKLVEKVSGQSLDEYFKQNILEPLGMTDTHFNLPPEKEPRLVNLHQRQKDGSLLEAPREAPPTVTFFSGGGGLLSTAGDYLKFLRMLLNGGQLGEVRILKPETVALMSENQIGELEVESLTSLAPEIANDVDFYPGSVAKFGFGFLINSDPVEQGRSAGSLAWAGIYNTYFWIDPQQKVCGVILMQSLPFFDGEAVQLYGEFERGIYTSLSEY